MIQQSISPDSQTRRLLVFGGSGFVGGHLALMASDSGWRVTIADAHPHPALQSFEFQEVDITSAALVEKVVAGAMPQVVVNLAAIADIDLAERDHELAWKVNVLGARNVAASSSRYGARYVFFSSDAVFDGIGRDYTEESPIHPINYYGQTKAEAELAVLKAHASAVVLRISLVLGYPVTSGNSFLSSLEKKLQAGLKVFAPLDEVRTPIDVTTLCEAVLELGLGGYTGRLQVGSTNSIDRYALTRRLAALLGYPKEQVQYQDPAQPIPGRAPRHCNGIISVQKAQSILKTPLLNLDKTLERAIATRPVSK